jgi:Flp pilus assembly protein TadD
MLRRAAERFPIDPAALLLYATVAERQNRPDEARRALVAYTALVASDPDLVAHAMKIATWSLRVNDVETARLWIRRALQKDPQHATLVALAERVERAAR